MNKSNKAAKERKGYKFRLTVPNIDIENQLAQYVGCCRFVWNKALAELKADTEDYHTRVTMSRMNGGTEESISSQFSW